MAVTTAFDATCFGLKIYKKKITTDLVGIRKKNIILMVNCQYKNSLFP
jgi:hypothetical protein